MKWTKEIPKEKGYYWVKFNDVPEFSFSDDPSEAGVVWFEFDEEEKIIWPILNDTTTSIDNIRLWSDEAIPYPEKE